ncbi:MAG: hypothetical protein KGI35_04150, partial [Burkholderiales bacterium]|nr:hypothetical protein [Burkholderiales bacterium]
MQPRAGRRKPDRDAGSWFFVTLCAQVGLLRRDRGRVGPAIRRACTGVTTSASFGNLQASLLKVHHQPSLSTEPLRNMFVL